MKQRNDSEMVAMYNKEVWNFNFEFVIDCKGNMYVYQNGKIKKL